MLHRLTYIFLGLLITACPKSSDPVLSKARLGLQPAELDFGEDDTQKAFTVKNVGQQNLTWTISEDVDWVVDFQSTSGKIDGGGQSQITVKIDRAKLKDGANTSKIQVTATADDGGQLEGGGKDVTVKATKPAPPKVSMSKNDVLEINKTTAKVKGTIETIGSSNITQHGHVWSSQVNPDITDGDDPQTKLGERSNKGNFQKTISKLKGNTTYYIRAYATNKVGTAYSSEVKFTTTDNDAPTGITLSNLRLTENNRADEVVGLLKTSDPDQADKHTYKLVKGSAYFEIKADTLRAIRVFKFSDQSSYSIAIETNDGEVELIQRILRSRLSSKRQIMRRRA